MSGALPPATPATPDLICWLWAAFSAPGGRLETARIADALGVSQRTVQRWIKGPSGHIPDHIRRRLRQRAILRGRGTYLWPAIDDTTRRRSAGELEYARRAHQLISDHPTRVDPTWSKRGYLSPRQVLLVHFPKAHVYGVSIAQHEKAVAKIESRGEIIRVRNAPNIFAARIIKGTALADHADHRTIVPNELVPTGRTETWRETAGAGHMPQLRRAL